MKKRILSLVLITAMIFTMLPVSAVFAETALSAELITNGNAEAEGITGWHDDTGAGRWASSEQFGTWAPPSEGSKYFFLFNAGMDILSGTLSQEIELFGTEGSGLFSMISEGRVSFRLSASMYQSKSEDNEAKVIVEEYSADGSLLQTTQLVNTAAATGAMDVYYTIAQLNPNTRKFKVLLYAKLTNGNYAQFDTVSLKLLDASGGNAPVFGSDFPTEAETDAGVPYTTTFTISDADPGDVNQLVFNASSTNVNLVPAANIVVSGSGETRTLSITPVGNLSGEADITIVASDGIKSTQKTFHFIVHKVISMDTNLVENSNGINGMAGWSGNTVNIDVSNNYFRAKAPNAYMYQNIDISKFSRLIDCGVTEFELSGRFASNQGVIEAQFYTDIACTNPIGSPVSIRNYSSQNQNVTAKGTIPAAAKGVRITFRNTDTGYNFIEVTDLSFMIINNFPKIAAAGTLRTDLNPTIIPVNVYYTTEAGTLSAQSSDQSIVPDSGIQIEGDYNAPTCQDNFLAFLS